MNFVSESTVLLWRPVRYYSTLYARYAKLKESNLIKAGIPEFLLRQKSFVSNLALSFVTVAVGAQQAVAENRVI